MLELYQRPLSEVPIPRISATEQIPFISRVDRILAAKTRHPSADTAALEAEIDELAFDLYGLTPAERAVVETTTVNSRSATG